MASVTVTAPDSGFTGTRAGVVFRDGRGEVDADDASALAYFARHGYALDVPSAPKKEPRSRTAATPAANDAIPTTEGERSDA